MTTGNAGNGMAAATDAAPRYNSLDAMQAAYLDLLQREGELTASTETDAADAPIITDIVAFVRRGQATGQLLASEKERRIAQTMLGYWTALLYRAGRPFLRAQLDDLDPKLLPDLANVRCPYKGLSPFGESDHEQFYGRDRLVAAMLSRLETSRLLCVVGASGSGKSSAVLGGLLPALKRGGVTGSQEWNYDLPVLVPGAAPLTQLARILCNGDSADAAAVQAKEEALRSDPGHLAELLNARYDRPALLIVDQFEEVFTLCDNSDAQGEFVACLVALTQSKGLRHTVVFTMRSDFETYVVRMSDLNALYEEAQIRMTPLNAADLQDVIAKPARMVGLQFGDGVVDTLIKEVLGEPAALPLLQFTLRTLWNRRRGNLVSWDAYRDIGGALNALATVADAFYRNLSVEEQEMVKRLLLRLVRPGDGLEVTSRRLPRHALKQGGEAPARIDGTLQKLEKEGLLRCTPGRAREDDQFEVAHEALIRNWPRLLDWLKAEADGIAMRRRLEIKAAEWIRLGRGTSELLDPMQLAEAERWLKSTEALYLGFDPSLQELVAASWSALLRAEQQKQAALRREQEQQERLALAERRRARERQRRGQEQARAVVRMRRAGVGLAIAAFLVTFEGSRANWQSFLANYRVKQLQLAQASVQNIKERSNAVGIDVAGFNGTIQWDGVKGAGVSFAIAEATDGVRGVDSQFAANWPQIKQAGLIRGAYHYYRLDQDPIRQARHFVTVLRQVGVQTMAPGDLPPVLGLDYQRATLDQVTIANNIQKWLDRVEQELGARPILFTSNRFADRYLPAQFSRYQLWCSDTSKGQTPQLPRIWSQWSLWQYDFLPKLAGIQGKVSLDRFNGAYRDLRAFVGLPDTKDDLTHESARWITDVTREPQTGAALRPSSEKRRETSVESPH